MRARSLLLLLLASAASANANDDILSLSVMVGGGIVPAHNTPVAQFRVSPFVQLGLLYNVYKTIGAGVGVNFLNRYVVTDQTKNIYKIDVLFGEVVWHPRYQAEGVGYFLGGKINAYVIHYGETGGLGSEDERDTAWGWEPFVGLLLPAFFSNTFIDMSAGYQFRRFPALYHMPVASRALNVTDNNFVVTGRVRF